MNDWILKSLDNKDWIFFICYSNYLIFAGLNWFFPIKFNSVFNFLSLDKKLKTQINKCFVIEPFNIGSFLIISTSISFLFYEFFKYFKNPILTPNDFLYIFFIISTTLICRFFIVKSIFSIFSIIDDVETFLSKNYSQNILLCFSTLILLFINEFSYLNDKIILICFISIILSWSISNFILISRYLKDRQNQFFYIIFYICSVKISPWLWIYLTIYETRIQV